MDTYVQKLRLILFRAVFQENKKALEGLLYALLALPEGSIATIDIENPIELGKLILICRGFHRSFMQNICCSTPKTGKFIVTSSVFVC